MPVHLSPPLGADLDASSSLPVPTSLTSGGVEISVVRWPADATVRDALAALQLPRLLLVDPGLSPPERLDPDEDWVRWPPDPYEMLVRAQHLAERTVIAQPPAPVTLDDDGVLRRANRAVYLSEAQVPVVRLLLDHADRVVRFEDVVDAYATSGGSTHPASVRTAVARIDAKVRPIGVEVTSVRRRGVVLRTLPDRAR